MSELKFETLSDGTLALAGHVQDWDAALEALTVHLSAQPGATLFGVRRRTRRAELSHTYYSDATASFTHDCTLHAPDEAVEHCADSRPVTIVIGLDEA
jgi:hypothetical protein